MPPGNRPHTEITAWQIVENGEADKPSLVVPVESYTMEPGDAQSHVD